MYICNLIAVIFYPQYFFDGYCQSANKRLEAYQNEFMKLLHREYNRQLLVSEVMWHTVAILFAIITLPM